MEKALATKDMLCRGLEHWPSYSSLSHVSVMRDIYDSHKENKSQTTMD